MHNHLHWSKFYLLLLALLGTIFVQWAYSKNFDHVVPHCLCFGALALGLLLEGLLMRHRDGRWARAAAPQAPAIPAPARMNELLTCDDALGGLRGRVREIRTFSAPMHGPDPATGVVPCFHSVLVDVHGEVHDLETAGSFCLIEQRARHLAHRLSVPFESGI